MIWLWRLLSIAVTLVRLVLLGKPIMLPKRARVYRFPCLIVGALGTLLALGCSGSAPPAEETAPPAPVKWMEARQLFIEQWTEIIGTTQPMPQRSARVSAGIEGR